MSMYQIRSYYPLVKMKAYFNDISEKRKIVNFLEDVKEKTIKRNGKLPDKNIVQYIEVIKIDDDLLPEYAKVLGKEDRLGKFHEWTKTHGHEPPPKTLNVVLNKT